MTKNEIDSYFYYKYKTALKALKEKNSILDFKYEKLDEMRLISRTSGPVP